MTVTWPETAKFGRIAHQDLRRSTSEAPGHAGVHAGRLGDAVAVDRGVIGFEADTRCVGNPDPAIFRQRDVAAGKSLRRDMEDLEQTDVIEMCRQLECRPVAGTE